MVTVDEGVFAGFSKSPCTWQEESYPRYTERKVHVCPGLTCRVTSRADIVEGYLPGT